MYQFYFLSIFVNLIGGILLSGDVLNKQFSKLEMLQELFKAPSYIIGFSIFSAITGIFKIISVFAGDVPVIGDLIPALLNIVIAVYLFISWQKNKKEELKPALEKTDVIIGKYENIIGITAIIVALLHFFFPDVLFI